MKIKWERLDDGHHWGYRSSDGSFEITDNGAGFGPSAGSGRWALMDAGRWISNFDTLALAKNEAAMRLSERS